MHQIVDVKSRIFRIGLYLIESESINYFGTLFLSNVKYKEETVSGVPVSAEASISALVFPFLYNRSAYINMPAVDLIGKLFLQRQVCISTGNRQCKWEIAMYRLHGEAVAARCKCRAVGIKVSADIYLLVGKLVDLQSHMIRSSPDACARKEPDTASGLSVKICFFV